MNNFHVLSEINPPEGVEEATFELALDRGESSRAGSSIPRDARWRVPELAA